MTIDVCLVYWEMHCGPREFANAMLLEISVIKFILLQALRLFHFACIFCPPAGPVCCVVYAGPGPPSHQSPSRNYNNYYNHAATIKHWEFRIIVLAANINTNRPVTSWQPFASLPGWAGIQDLCWNICSALNMKYKRLGWVFRFLSFCISDRWPWVKTLILVQPVDIPDAAKTMNIWSAILRTKNTRQTRLALGSTFALLLCLSTSYQVIPD